MTRTLLASVLLFVAATSFAQSPVVIERVDVHARRTRPDILISEMRLPKGRSYSIDEIEQAVYRLRRLPFVADATYTLEPGIAPGARVLHVNVVDDSPVHFALDVFAVAQRGGYVETFSQVGWRSYPSHNGVLDLNAGGAGHFAGGGTGAPHFGDLSAQYTAYGLFGTSAYAGIGVSSRYSSQNRLVSPLLLVGVPLTQTQTIRGTYNRSGEKTDSEAVATLQWLLERSDDPYFARRGFSVVAGPQWEKQHLVNDFGKFHLDDHLSTPGFTARGEKYRPFAEHGAYWGRANATYLSQTVTSNGVKGKPVHIQLGDVLGGVGWNFDQSRTAGDYFDRIRVELGGGYHRERTSGHGFVEDRSGAEIFFSAALRARGGFFRLSLSRVNSKR